MRSSLRDQIHFLMPSLDFDIIFLALPRWDGPYSSTAYSLAKALSKYARVFYVDNPFTIKDVLVHSRSAQVALRKNALWRGKDIFLRPDKHHRDLVVVTPRVTLPINWLPPGRLYDAFSRINDQAISIAIRETCQSYNIKRYVLINSFNPLIGRFLNLKLKPLLTVYQSVDDISQSAYVNKHGQRLEEEAIRKADFTIVTSSELKRLKSSLSEDVFLLPNAANTALFNTAVTETLEKPKELKAIAADKKVICYTGNICHRLDYELLTKVATQHPDKILLMVGPFASDEYKSSGLASLPNVMFAGRKVIDELPPYLKYSHCCIIPFRCNQLTRSIYPLKINEYLSAGKPVVSTNFSSDIQSFQRVAHITENHQQFVSAIDTAINEDSIEYVQNRVNFSSCNTWEARARDFIDISLGYLAEIDKPGRKLKQKAGVQAVKTQAV
jgi:teichuronic acid biosynthesis glycosyltransferase TuaH